MMNLRRRCGLLALGVAGVTAAAPSEAKADMTEIQCLQAQNEWIEDCLDGWDGIWTSLTGSLDNCVAEFDTAHPECLEVGVSAQEGADEIHEAYGASGEIIGGGLGIVGGIVGDVFECAVGGGVILYVGSEAGSIYITGVDYGGASVDDETIQEMVDACYATAATSGIFAGAIIAPELMATYIIGHLGLEVWDCYDACINNPDPHGCTETCYDMGAEAAALLAILYAGHVATDVLPPEMLAPEFMGYNLRPGGGIATEYETCEPAENGGRGECLDEALDNFRWRMEDPSLEETQVNNYEFETAQNTGEALEMLNTEVGGNPNLGGEFVEVTNGPLTQAELQIYLEGLEPGSHAIVVGEGLGPVEPNHAIYVFVGPGGVSPSGAMGYPWPNYYVNVYVPPGGTPPPPPTPPVGPPFDPAAGGSNTGGSNTGSAGGTGGEQLPPDPGDW